jgi:tetratricopeptide (TPR) repeat protein
LSAALVLATLLSTAQPAPAARPADAVVSASTASFEELWAVHVKADASGDADGAERALREIRRVLVERNVEGHETLGLGLLGRGVEHLDRSERDAAEEAFRNATSVAPALPDAHFGLATAQLRRGPLGVIPSIAATWSGTAAFLDSARGALNARDLATVAWLVLCFGFAWALGLVLLLRHGSLLRHDVEEWLGPTQSRAASFALFLLLLLIPVATFQGWGWLAAWWLALLFSYSGRGERVLIGLVLASALSVGPAAASLDVRLRTAQNPLFQAALAAVEGVPDRTEVALLEEAVGQDPQDRDLAYLVGAARKRSGRYDSAAELYRRLLAADPRDVVARNNLANLEFLRRSYDSALARYKEGTQAGGEAAATSYYNLSLAQLQKFDYQAFNEAKSNADRLAGGVGRYDRWKYDSGDYAVVDMGLSRDQVWTKFEGAASGVAVRNVSAGAPPLPQAGTLAGSLANRFAAGIAVVALVAFIVSRVRGPKAFTLHCGKCGTAFCRNCHLGRVSGGLCSQCYHLFVVRDGVSGPARNRKMAEVQRADARRGRVFRALSVLAPGTGHLYAGRSVVGALLLLAWCSILSVLVASRLVPFTEAPSRLVPPWPMLAAGLLLAAVWIVANRLAPDFGVQLPTRRPQARRSRAQEA